MINFVATANCIHAVEGLVMLLAVAVLVFQSDQVWATDAAADPRAGETTFGVEAWVFGNLNDRIDDFNGAVFFGKNDCHAVKNANLNRGQPHAVRVE